MTLPKFGDPGPVYPELKLSSKISSNDFLLIETAVSSL